MVVDDKGSAFIDPDAAKEYIERTRIDSLAVAIGSAHGLYKGKSRIDFERLTKIRDKVDFSLVLHGALGICKMNVATELKIAFSGDLK